MLSLVLFDLGDVIASYDPAPRIAEYAQRSGLDPKEVSRRLWKSGFSIACDRGRHPAAEMQTEIGARLGVEFARDELLRLQAAAFRVRPEMLELVDEVGRSARTGILTNNSPLLEEAFPLHFPELCEQFDPILFSHRFEHVKPEPELFERVTAQLGLPAGDILFVDDQETHVAAARRAGWQARSFTSPAALRRELAQLGLVGEHP